VSSEINTCLVYEVALKMTCYSQGRPQGLKMWTHIGGERSELEGDAYDYQLTTLMTVDEHAEGFPFAFCFSSRVDECTMQAFLSVVKDNIGVSLDDAVLMTDDTEVYANAWKHVIGQPAHRLLCTWHVDSAWRRNLCKIKGDGLLQATVYKTVRALMEITDPEVFTLSCRISCRVPNVTIKRSNLAYTLTKSTRADHSCGHTVTDWD